MAATTISRSRPKPRFTPGQILVNGILALIVIIWLLPAVGLLISSFRSRFALNLDS